MSAVLQSICRPSRHLLASSKFLSASLSPIAPNVRLSQTTPAPKAGEEQWPTDVAHLVDPKKAVVFVFPGQGVHM